MFQNMENVHNFLNPLPLPQDVLDFSEFGKKFEFGKILNFGNPPKKKKHKIKALKIAQKSL